MTSHEDVVLVVENGMGEEEEGDGSPMTHSECLLG